MNKIMMIVIVISLLAINWLTFHDFFEPHTTKDWLTLATSVFALAYLAKVSLRRVR